MSMDTIERHGQLYEYDADFDVYRRVPDQQPLTRLQRIVYWLTAIALTIFTIWTIIHEHF